MNDDAQMSRHRAATQTRVASTLAALCAIGGQWLLADDAKSLPLTAAVKILSSSNTGSDTSMQTPMMLQPARPQPTLPDGKLPQYQMGADQRQLPTAEQLANPKLRLILAAPTGPLLIEARITIDGQPFHSARERRITTIIEAASQPAPVVVAPTPDATAPNSLTDAAVASVEGSFDESADDVSNQKDAEAPAECTDEDQGDGSADEELAHSDDGDEPGAEPIPPPTLPAYTLPNSATEFVKRYTVATGVEATPDEVRWLLTNRLDGPTVLLLRDNFQRFRAAQRPVPDVLDQNRDGIVGEEELAAAVKSFQECDVNRDDIVDYTEIARVANDPRRMKTSAENFGTLIVPVPDAEAASATYSRLAARYAKVSSEKDGDTEPTTATLPRFDDNRNGLFDDAELQSLLDITVDITLEITFSSTKPDESQIAITGVSELLASTLPQATTDTHSVTLMVEGVPLTLSALQGATSDQVSIGAVEDGYPLLPAIDPNDDGRFTIRELRSLVARLQTFDLNNDGQLTIDETRAPLRVCFGLGPVVHQELAGIRSINRPTTTTSPLPEWFVRMDRNKDNDLTRSEFPGTDEQFAELDADADELVSADEAYRSDPQTATSTEEEIAPVEEPETPKTEIPETETRDTETPEISSEESNESS